jgi:hypothetical protein
VHVFNRPVSPAVTEATVGSAVDINYSGVNQKAFDSDGNPTLAANFSESRDTLTISVTEPLNDGTEEYELKNLNTAVNSLAGARYGEPINTVPSGVIKDTQPFDIGEDLNQPSAELVVENVQNTPLDFTDSQVDLTVRVNNTSDVELKQTGTAAEIFVKAAGEDQFTSVQTISAGNMDFGESGNQPITISGNPFQADADEYEDIEVAARVTSLNEVESGLATQTLSDTDSLGVDDANTQFSDVNAESNGQELVVTFDEPVADVRRGDSGTNLFNIVETASGDATTIGQVLEVSGGTVVVAVTDDGSNTSNDRVIVDPGVTDLAGNPIEVGDNDPSTSGDDDNAVDL